MHGYDIQDTLQNLLDQKDPEGGEEEREEKIKKIVLEECQCPDGTIFSGFISVYAEAIAWLGERGILEIISDNGGRVVEARLLEKRRCPKN